MSITSTLFVSYSGILDNTPFSIESIKTDYPLKCRYCWCSVIKYSIIAAHDLGKYTQKVILYKVLTGKECLGPDILPEIPNQADGIKDIMTTVWVKKTYYWQKVNGTKT